MANLPALVFVIPIILIGLALTLYPVFTTGSFNFGGQETSYTEQLRYRNALLEERRVIYEAIIELDFDYSVDKIAHADYAQQRYELVAQAADILQQLDSLTQLAKDPIEEALQTRQYNTDDCPTCGAENRISDRFCRTCGAALHAPPSTEAVAHATR